MAKLGARGRKELARVAKTVNPSEPDALVSERRYTLALMDDRSLLEKIDVVFKSDGRHHSYGWKVKVRKVRADLTPETFVAQFTQAGYARV